MFARILVDDPQAAIPSKTAFCLMTGDLRLMFLVIAERLGQRVILC
jgi:hypothetical protein